MSDDYEMVDVKLPKSEYDRLKKILERERAYDWIGVKLRNHLIWILGTGALTLFLLWEKLQFLFNTPVK